MVFKGSRTTSAPLSSLGVLVTRPEPQAESFCALITKAGATALSLPAIEIKPLPLDGLTLPSSYRKSRLAIFISRNAVEYASDLIKMLPVSTRLVAIGGKTAEYMRSLGLQVSLAPQHGFTSEALLAMPELQTLDNTQVTIFRGEGGRTLLADELGRRGADVTCVNCYRRCIPTYPRKTLKKYLTDASPQVVTMTSVETLRNFLVITDKLPSFNPRKLAVIAGSKRIGSAIEEAGFIAPWIADDPTDESMLQALIQWNNTRLLNNDQSQA